MSNASNLSSFIWSVADLLRGSYRQSDYGKVILPFTVLRRLDCILKPTKDKVLEEFKKRTAEGVDPTPFLTRIAKQSFYNSSPLDLNKALAQPTQIKANLLSYINGFSSNVGDIFEKYEFDDQIDKLANADLLFLVAKKFSEIDLHPNQVSNADMGLIFEELIRKFAELSNETAGEHFTPREVIRLMVDLLFHGDSEALSKPGVIRTLYDPTAGTGGMLSIAEEYLTGPNGLNPDATLIVSGQELNPESYAICKGDMLIKGQDISNIKFGDTLKNDGHAGVKFDYGLSNPPFGVEWKKAEKEVKDEYERLGFAGRFGPGLPRISDGSLLFLLHLISKMREPEKGGGRIAIVLNGSPLFTGGAGSGESEIRKWVIEQDLLETIIGLPTDMFYNTGISTYIWVLSNHKAKERKGKIQLINASEFFQKMRKSLGSKRKELGETDIERIIKLYGEFDENENSKIFDAQDFGYTTITVERPLLDEEGKIVISTKGKTKGNPQADSNLRDTENVPLKENIEEYFKREVLPHAPDAWIDKEKTKVGYEIPFTRHFYVYKPPRALSEIDTELKKTTDKIVEMIRGLSA
ncbi:type I restriction-modification system subunit M [Polynucleobacter sp. HIN5]|uniref:type I restriction-modification system subunit M n=1 Tax=Polynucleobacter sp. HIN5 TaxID=3047864 RepID=UPI0025731E49|nr:class I SAM-dependent DNA methyltransferase [Polynucleobacter sp. HIN5]BEI33217.1 class I SAM-dependent DNA methyltransferase [Polynucleobacter sp. HIN5]